VAKSDIQHVPYRGAVNLMPLLLPKAGVENSEEINAFVADQLHSTRGERFSRDAMLCDDRQASTVAGHRKALISAMNFDHAGSSGNGTWFSESKLTSLAFGMDVAIRRPSSKGVPLS
jgi:hypothetical protein